MGNSVLESCILSFKLLDLLVFGIFLISSRGISGVLGVKGKVFELLQECILEGIKIWEEFFLELLGVFVFSWCDYDKGKSTSGLNWGKFLNSCLHR